MAESTLPALSAENPTFPGTNFIRGAAGMPIVRQFTLLFAIAGSVAIALGAMFYMQSPDYRPLAGVTSAQQASEIATVLDEHAIAYRLDQQTGTLLVAQDRIHEARMHLAGSSAIDGRQMGYELLDEDQGFGVSQFMENARHRRSVEGELARSISTIDAVHSARVLLALPKTTTFLRDRRRPTASVTVRLLAGKALGGTQVKGITNLVAGAVPELAAEDVAVVDQSGKLLSAGEDPAMEQSSRQLKHVAELERQLREKINNILLPTLGPNRFSAEVKAEMDFTRTELAQEVFDPNTVAVRSEQQLDETRTAEDQVGGVPGALTNQPPATQPAAAATAPEGESGQRQTRSQLTRNYEVDRSLTYTQQGIGQLIRLSISVVVDDALATNAETGETERQPWQPEELERLTTLVQSAVGYDAERGDLINVVNSAFWDEALPEAEIPPFWSESWFIDLMKQVLGGLVLLLLVVGLLRPMFRNLSQAGEVVRERQNLAIAEISRAKESSVVEPGALPAGNAGLLTSGSSMDARVDTVRGLVEEDAGRVAQVVKHWVADDE